ncbi:uncharacterized protein B0H18DRAFT_1121894 [Fomitopsis serialis]|uniref:uncharacterized protein n=1 Tax=Fomitopsis serialis TaxID=139415 RepID=UPI002008B208|nr:uncharacterized protein B0H18DRAFT_1121894 [Neoantrodia serialis]KAH9920426.1 hypothetical protein B0H18DRAFT_1121894 [Neoantrodia serialis]
MRFGRTVRRRQDIALAFRQDNSSASASDTGSGTSAASAPADRWFFSGKRFTGVHNILVGRHQRCPKCAIFHVVLHAFCYAIVYFLDHDLIYYAAVILIVSTFIKFSAALVQLGFHSASSTSSGSSSTTTPPPSSSSSASGRETTIGTSTIVQTVNGQVTTSFQPIVTTMTQSDSGGLSPTANKGIIAGSVVGVCALLILAFAMVVFYRRHRHKKLDFFKRKQPKPRNMLLAGEDLDDLDMGPPMASYRDYPGSMVSHSASPSVAGHNASGSISGSIMNPQASYSRVHIPGTPMPSPHLMGMRTSEAGSIFQEQVWPPPRTAFVDPLVSTDDLTRIVDDSTTSLDSVPDMPVAGGRHGKTPSQTTLLPPASPQTPTRRTPLFVTNMGSEAPSIYSQQSPPLGASKHLSSEAELRQPLSTEGEPMGEAL